MDFLANQFNPFNGTQLCSDEDPELFFPEYEEQRQGYLIRINKAKDICNSCWIKEDCLKYALQFPDLQGIWGATTPHERKKIRHEAHQRSKA
jgi:WhiB family redox-sensing transcriptional regulator